MSDIFDKRTRSEIMRSVKSKNTKSTELALIKLFKENHITGWRHNYNVKGHPDFVFLNKRIAIFVDGCFWHGHEGCKYFVWPKSNADFWKEKISGNIRRDKDNIRKLSQLGWNIITVWECELKTDKREETLSKLVHQIKTGMLRGE